MFIELTVNLKSVPRLRGNDEFFKMENSYDQIFYICTCNCYDNNRKRQKRRCKTRLPMIE